MAPPLELTREQILAHRRRAGALDRRLPPGPDSLRRAAWAGLQDSMPRAAVLSIHARVEGTQPSSFADPSLVQVWGPRYSAFVVAAEDLRVFTLGRLPDDERGQRIAQDMADRLEAFLDGRRMAYEQAGREMGLNPNALRYAAPTGRVLIRWDGARSPTIWTVPAPDMDARDARLELARRFLRVFGPRPGRRVRGLGRDQAKRAHAHLRCAGRGAPAGADTRRRGLDPGRRRTELPPAARATGARAPAAQRRRLFLAWGVDRELLVADAERRPILWTPRVWPGALLVEGEIAGVWRRRQANVSIEPVAPAHP